MTSGIDDDAMTNKAHRAFFVFHCCDCDVNTSGIHMLEVNPKRRFCPFCQSVLAWCHNCKAYLSTRNNDGTLVCAKCEERILPKHVDEFNN